MAHIIEITTKIGCTNFCTYCPQETLIRNYRKTNGQTIMSLELFKTCIDKLPSNFDIHFTGMCEPFMNTACTDMILHAFFSGKKVYVSTTLIGMTPQDIKNIENIPFKGFAVHMPSSSNEKIPIDAQYIKTLEALQKSKIKFNTHYHGQKPHAILKNLLPKANFPVGINAHTRANNTGKSKVKITGNLICKRKFQQNVLLPNGDVLLCCMDYGMKHVLGNLFTNDIYDIWNSKESQYIRNAAKDDTKCLLCRYCEAYAINGQNNNE